MCVVMFEACSYGTVFVVKVYTRDSKLSITIRSQKWHHLIQWTLL